MKKKTLPKKTQASPKKANTAGKDESTKQAAAKKVKPAPNKVKAKKSAKPKPKPKPCDSDNSSNDSDSDRESSVDRKPVLKKLKKSIARKAAKVAISKTTDVKDVVVRKRMASLNASAMMAATYEVERQLDKCEEKMYKISADTEEHISPPKKPKDIKNEVFEPKDVRIDRLGGSGRVTAPMFVNVAEIH